MLKYLQQRWLPTCDDYLQIDLLYEYVICAVATQGNPPTQSPTAQEWTTEYKLRFSLNGTTFFPYKENKTDKVGMSCSRIHNSQN